MARRKILYFLFAGCSAMSMGPSVTAAGPGTALPAEGAAEEERADDDHHASQYHLADDLPEAVLQRVATFSVNDAYAAVVDRYLELESAFRYAEQLVDMGHLPRRERFPPRRGRFPLQERVTGLLWWYQVRDPFLKLCDYTTSLLRFPQLPLDHHTPFNEEPYYSSLREGEVRSPESPSPPQDTRSSALLPDNMRVQFSIRLGAPVRVKPWGAYGGKSAPEMYNWLESVSDLDPSFVKWSAYLQQYAEEEVTGEVVGTFPRIDPVGRPLLAGQPPSSGSPMSYLVRFQKKLAWAAGVEVRRSLSGDSPFRSLPGVPLEDEEEEVDMPVSKRRRIEQQRQQGQGGERHAADEGTTDCPMKQEEEEGIPVDGILPRMGSHPGWSIAEWLEWDSADAAVFRPGAQNHFGSEEEEEVDIPGPPGAWRLSRTGATSLPHGGAEGEYIELEVPFYRLYVDVIEAGERDMNPLQADIVAVNHLQALGEEAEEEFRA